MQSQVKKRRLAALEKRVSSPGGVSGAGAKPSGNIKSSNGYGSGDRKAVASASNRGTRRIPPQGQACPSPIAESKNRTNAALAGAAGTQMLQQGPGCVTADQARDLPVYQPLMSDALAPAFAKMQESAAGSGPGVDFKTGLLEKLLGTSSRGLDPREVIKSKVQDQILVLDNPTSHIPQHGRRRRNSQAETMIEAFKSQARCRKRRHMLPDAGSVRYADFRALNRQWEEYISTTLQNARSEDAAIGAADLHGGVLTVVSSRGSPKVGSRGIIIREGENAFHVVTEDDRLLVFQKTGVVFRLDLPHNRRALLHGNRLRKLSAIGTAS